MQILTLVLIFVPIAFFFLRHILSSSILIYTSHCVAYKGWTAFLKKNCVKHNLLITNRYRLVFIGTTLCNCNMLKPLFIISCSFLKLLMTRLSISYSFLQLLLFTFYNSHNILLLLRVNINHHFLFFNLAML